MWLIWPMSVDQDLVAEWPGDVISFGVNAEDIWRVKRMQVTAAGLMREVASHGYGENVSTSSRLV